jgi:hypothetical protein
VHQTSGRVRHIDGFIRAGYQVCSELAHTATCFERAQHVDDPLSTTNRRYSPGLAVTFG